MFQFCGTVGLQWIEKNKSKYTKYFVVPDKSFEVYLHCSLRCSQLNPALPLEKAFIPHLPPISSPPALNEDSPSTSLSTVLVGSFDGDGLAEVLDDRSKALQRQTESKLSKVLSKAMKVLKTALAMVLTLQVYS